MPPFMRQINITSRCATLYRERQLAGTGLSGCHTPYLLALYRRPGISQEELARDLNVNKSSVTRQLSAMEEKGYVRREPDPADRRSLLGGELRGIPVHPVRLDHPKHRPPLPV